MVTEPFEVVAIDSIGPFPVDAFGNAYVIVIIDAFTRFVELTPCQSTTAVEAAKALLVSFGRYGCPRALRSDNGPQYDNAIIAEFLRLCGTAQLKTVPYRSQQNGLVERCNREVGRHLRCLMFDQRVDARWSTYLPIIQRIVNSTYHSAIGTSPMRLLFGDSITCNRGLIFPFSEHGDSVVEDYIIDLNAVEKHLVLTSQKFQAEVIKKYLESAPKNPKSFAVGDQVVVSYPVRPPTKLAVRWKGPYVIISKGDRTYVCQDPVSLKDSVYDIERLRLWKSSSTTMPIDQIRLRDDQTYEVEAILRHEGDTPSSMRFYVKWVGYGDDECSWVPWKDLKYNVVLKDYLVKKKIKVKNSSRL